MGQASLFRFRTRGTRGLRILTLTTEVTARIELWNALRADGHDLICTQGLMEFVFALDVVNEGAGECPDLIILDGSSWAAAIPDALMWFGPPLQNVPVFVLSASAIAEAPTHSDVELHFFPYPLELDDLRMAVMNVEAWQRNVLEKAPVPRPRIAQPVVVEYGRKPRTQQ